MTVVVASDDDRFIVRVCFGTTLPPQRAWFAVARRDLATTPSEPVNDNGTLYGIN